MWPIYGWNVTTLWVNCPLWVSQPGQLSIPSLWGRQMRSNPCIYMDYEGGYHRQNRAVWLQANVRERGLGLRPRLNANPVCDAQRRWCVTCGLWRCMSEPCFFNFYLIVRRCCGFQSIRNGPLTASVSGTVQRWPIACCLYWAMAAHCRCVDWRSVDFWGPIFEKSYDEFTIINMLIFTRSYDDFMIYDKVWSQISSHNIYLFKLWLRNSLRVFMWCGQWKCFISLNFFSWPSFIIHTTGFQHLWLVAIFIYDNNFTIFCDDLMTNLRRLYDEVITIFWSTYDFSEIGSLTPPSYSGMPSFFAILCIFWPRP